MDRAATHGASVGGYPREIRLGGISSGRATGAPDVNAHVKSRSSLGLRSRAEAPVAAASALGLDVVEYPAFAPQLLNSSV